MADLEEEKKEEKVNHGNTCLPFGLCKRYGIELSENATPRQAWDALYNKKGIQPKQVYEKLNQSSAESKVVALQGTALQYLKDRGMSRYDKTILANDPWAEKKYYELIDKYDNGQKPVLNYKPTLKQRLLSYIESIQVRNAKRILKLDSDADTSVEKKYWNRNLDIIRALSEKESQTKTLPVSKKLSSENQVKSQEEKNREEAIEYFKRYVEQKRKLKNEGKYEEREITSSTYKRAQNKLKRQVEQWLSR